MTSGQVGDLYWHVHHDQLAEVLTQPIEKRIAYINTRKPEHERATRLRWMTPVLTLDDPALADLISGLARAWADRIQAWADLRRAQADLRRAQADRDRSQADFDRAWAALLRARAALEPLHAIEHPGCPWDAQTLVFPKVTP